MGNNTVRTMTLTCLVLALLGTLATAAHADRALVVRVDHYPSLVDRDLTGCANDARQMADVLKSLGFQVTLLTDAQASRDGILQALRNIQTTCKPTERFLFYFAGHGNGPNPANILTHSSLPQDARNDLQADDLNKVIRSIPASSRTVLLDSCFSGAMTRELEGRTRYYSRASSKGVELLANNQDTNTYLSGDGSNTGPVLAPVDATTVCYFTAARQNEVAHEYDFNGTSHGVFTFYLLQELKARPDLWGALQMGVSAGVAERVQNHQHPTLSPAFVAVPLFGNAVVGGATATMRPKSLWELFNADSVDPGRICIVMHPDRSTIQLGERIDFRVQVGADGYLVLLEHGVSGRVSLQYPVSGKATDGHVKRGDVVTIPDPGEKFEADAPGLERLRAVLFNSPEVADQVMAAISAGGANGIPFDELPARLKQIQLKPGSDIRFVTSDVMFGVLSK